MTTSQESIIRTEDPRSTGVDGRLNLVGLSRAELEAEIVSMGLERFRARQLWHWIYHRGVVEFSEMTTLAKSVRESLAVRYSCARALIANRQDSADGTNKWLIAFEDGNEAEAVYIPEEDRGALCLSSQVGCTLACTFCHTGTQPLVRNLTAGEIVAQVLIARDHYGEWPSPPGGRMISNIVMMGMGEPLFNYDNVAKALTIVMDNEGLSISRRRITLSTSGVVPMIPRVGAELGVNLAVSLHAVTDDLRDTLVPINRKYRIAQLMDACRAYPGASNARRITFEYVMLKGVNDSPADAKALTRLIAGIPAKVNLIPFNPWPGTAFECSTDKAIAAFAEIVNRAGYSAPVRVPRGRDILAACGQLKSASHRAAANIRLTYLCHSDGRLDPGCNTDSLKGVLNRQCINNGSEHTHIVGGGSIHARGRARQTAKNIAAADDQTDLAPGGHHRLNVLRELGNGILIHAVLTGAHQTFARHLHQYAFIRQPLDHSSLHGGASAPSLTGRMSVRPVSSSDCGHLRSEVRFFLLDALAQAIADETHHLHRGPDIRGSLLNRLSHLCLVFHDVRLL